MTQKEILSKLTNDVLEFINVEDPSIRVLNLYLANWMIDNKIEINEKKQDDLVPIDTTITLSKGE